MNIYVLNSWLNYKELVKLATIKVVGTYGLFEVNYRVSVETRIGRTRSRARNCKLFHVKFRVVLEEVEKHTT